jgi:transposase-like protein
MQISKRIKQHGRYDRSLKREVARRYLAGEFSYRIAAEEYGLRSGEVVKQFVRWYRQQNDYLEIMEPQNESETILPTSRPEKVSEVVTDELAQLSQGELLQLARRLQQQRDEALLAAQGWRTMIDLAEQSFNIQIVKKSVAKPSAK